ncbi:MAG: hypothetical protein BWY71_01062 [Planctomycetes bacterium ADurb.Bin412]|nr:MAG: hypothetical protein BWY71_01062 [Planctomycetes bacterium ADurb.Bin412]
MFNGFQHFVAQFRGPFAIAITYQRVDRQDIFTKRMYITIGLYAQPVIARAKREIVRILTEFTQIFHHALFLLGWNFESNCILQTQHRIQPTTDVMIPGMIAARTARFRHNKVRQII